MTQKKSNNAGLGCVVLLGLFVLVGSCNAVLGDDEPSRSTTADRSVAPTTPAAPECENPADGYDGESGCYPGGEVVTVSQVVDGDTAMLVDGRKVGLLGVDRPPIDGCAGPEAAERLRGEVEGEQAMLHREPWVGHDAFGRGLAYMKVGSSRQFTTDIGDYLVSQGLAVPEASSRAHPAYMATITASSKLAREYHLGQFGPPCGKPMPSSGGGGGDVNVDADADAPNGNLPDGALTGGYCARKWWC